MISGDKVEDRKTWTQYKSQTEAAMIYLQLIQMDSRL